MVNSLKSFILGRQECGREFVPRRKLLDVGVAFLLAGPLFSLVGKLGARLIHHGVLGMVERRADRTHVIRGRASMLSGGGLALWKEKKYISSYGS